MKRREFVGAGLALASTWPLTGWSVVLKNVGDVAAKSLDGGDLNLPGAAVEDFAAGLRGDLLLPGSPGYDSRRRVWNGMFDRKPALIACCTGASDVRRAVDFARENRLLTAVRAGGHSVSGKSTCDGGLVIDLQQMQGVRVDPGKRRAYLDAGSRLGLLDHECAAFGLATTAGTYSITGAAGLTLGGGFGRLGRRFGLACDNVASFERRDGRREVPAGERRRKRGSLLGPARRRRQFRRRDGYRVPASPSRSDDSRRLPGLAHRAGPRCNALLPRPRAGRPGSRQPASGAVLAGRQDTLLRRRSLLVRGPRRRRSLVEVAARLRQADHR